MTYILTKYIPPAIALYDFIRKSKPRRFCLEDLDEVSTKIAFKTHDSAKEILEEMYKVEVNIFSNDSGKIEVWIGSQHAFDIWGTPTVGRTVSRTVSSMKIFLNSTYGAYL